MIAYLEGTIQQKEDQHLVVLVNNIGYKVFTLPGALLASQIGATAKLHTHQHVREDSLDLYGFERPEELKTFETLIGVTGIGPKSALGILSITTPENLRTAVASGNVGLLTKVSGIGRKTAERLIVELRDTFTLEAKRRGEPAATYQEGDIEVIEALEHLGYSVSEARKTLEAIPKDLTETEARLKAALRQLAK